LISAAKQAEAPPEAPSERPEEFAEDVGEPKLVDQLAQPALPGDQDSRTESADEPSELDVADMEQEVAISQATPEVEELEEALPSEAATAVEAAETEAELEQPLEISETSEAEERVAEVEPIVEEAPSPEVRKKEDPLERSRQALASGDTQAAVETYGDLVKRKESLDRVIEDLRIAVDRTPDNADLWQILGDAYMRDDQTDEAIDAYRKGMEAA